MSIKPALLLNNALQSNNCPNLILYGDKYVGKNYELMIILNKFISKKNNKIITEKEIVKITNPLYSIFDLKQICNKNIHKFFNILIELIQSKNYYINSPYRIIIFRNFNLIKHIIQQKLRVIIEKYRYTTVFIIITHKFGSILDPIKSRCLCIRFPALINHEKRQFIRNIIPNKSYKIKSLIYDESYKINNLSDMKLYAEFHEDLINFKNPYQIIMDRLELIIKKDKLTKSDILWTKDISYKIEKYNLNNFYEEFLTSLIMNPKFTFNKKIKLIQLFANSEYKYNKSYRSLIHIELLFFNIYQLFARNNEIDYNKEE